MNAQSGAIRSGVNAMDEVKKFFQDAYTEAKALEAKLAADVEAVEQHIAALEQKLGLDATTLELTQPVDQAAA